MHLTVAAFLAEAGATANPLSASATAAAARVVPETRLTFILISSRIRSQGEQTVSPGKEPTKYYSL